MSKKLFVVADVHGFYDEMKKALNEQGYDKNNSDHIFVSCGDLFDRGKQANKCMHFVNSLPKDNKILICGNHELLLDDILYKKKYFDSWDYSNGTVNTIEQLTGITESYNEDGSSWLVRSTMIDGMRHNKSWDEYFLNTVMFAEVGNYIFVHGWIPCALDAWGKHLKYNPNWRDTPYRDWKDATWINGMSAWDDGVVEPNKTIVCGHWHTSWGHSYLHNVGYEWGGGIDFGKGEDYSAHFEPFEDEGIIALDACTAYSGQVNCIVLEVTDEEWDNRKV